MYQGADREQRILEGAKKEKQVTVYTSRMRCSRSAPWYI